MQWEYLRVPIHIEDGQPKGLNELGAEGWELVTVVGNGGFSVAYMQRQKQDAAFVPIGEPS